MDKIKSFKSFIKENIDDGNLDNKIENIDQDDVLMNMKDIPSELWSPEMIDAQKEFENTEQDDELENIDDEIYEEGEGDDKKMMHKEEEIELSEKKKSSEEEDYIIKDVFDEEEIENEN